MVFKFNPITNRLDITGASGGGGGISSITGDSGGAISADGSGNINIIGGGSVTVAGDALTNTLTISVPSTFFAWSVITANQMAVIFQGYFTNGGASVEVTLPATSSVGDTFRVVDKGGNGWTLKQGAGQYIKFKEATSTTGTGGSITSQKRGDSAELVCSVANTEWWIIDSIGTFTVV
jgi:hypothetical protein